MVNCSNRTLVKMRFDADINQCHESGCDEDGKNNGHISHITALRRQIPAGRPATVVYAQVLKIRQRFEGVAPAPSDSQGGRGLRRLLVFSYGCNSAPARTCGLPILLIGLRVPIAPREDKIGVAGSGRPRYSFVRYCCAYGYPPSRIELGDIFRGLRQAWQTTTGPCRLG